MIHDIKCYNFFKLARYSWIIFFLNVRTEYNNSKIGNSQVNMKTNTHFLSYLTQLFL
jgi:hypothetical protein